MSQAVNKVRPQSLKAWFLAVRPKTLMAAVIPILVGSCLPNIPFINMDWLVAFSALLAALTLTVATNLINDALDFKKGADTNQRIGPLRVTQGGLLTANQVLLGGFIFLLISLGFAVPLMLKGGIPLVVVAFASAICSYLYTGGPYPLAYTGLGEVFVLIFYGLVATLSSYYLQAHEISFDAIIVSLQMGLLASVLIAINNLRDIQEDRKSGKNTLAVRFGLNFGRWEVTAFIVLPFFLNLYWLLTGQLILCLLPSMAFLMGINLIRGIWKHSPSRLYNRYLGEASLLLTAFGLLFILAQRLS